MTLVNGNLFVNAICGGSDEPESEHLAVVHVLGVSSVKEGGWTSTSEIWKKAESGSA